MPWIFVAKVFETLKHHTKHVTNHTFISSIPKKPQLCLDYQAIKYICKLVFDSIFFYYTGSMEIYQANSPKKNNKQPQQVHQVNWLGS